MTIKIEKMMENQKTIDGEVNNRKRVQTPVKKGSDGLSRDRKKLRKKLDQVR